MLEIETLFKNKKPIPEKLSSFGFTKTDNIFELKTPLEEPNFLMTIRIEIENPTKITAEITDTETASPYTLHLVPKATGEFVGKIREQYENTLAEIAKKCFDLDVFKAPQSLEIINYAKEKYSDKLEFLWNDFNGAIIRRKDTEKWYAVFMLVARKKLIATGNIEKDNEIVEVIDLHTRPEDLDCLADSKKIFRGWHMNKKHWLSIILDGSVSTKEILELVDKSYELGKK